MALAEPPGWYVISLRPQGGHGALRRAAAAQGAGLIALSPWRLRPRMDEDARQALQAALDATRVVFTSPAAVRAASGLVPLRSDAHRQWIAVGAGTARALARAGIDTVVSPARMDSEGVLALEALANVRGEVIGLVTAPGGRDALAAALHARGASVRRADVYSREHVMVSRASLNSLIALDKPAVLLLSSEGALRHVLETVPPNAAGVLRALPVVAASERLREVARREGFADPAVAEGPLPAQLVAAAARRFR